MSIKTNTAALVTALTALTLLTPLPASAQRNGGGGGQPGGSYTGTCSNARSDGGRLYAECRTGGRDSRFSSIEYGRCLGDISNDQGMLSCNGAQGRPESGNGNSGGENGGGWGGNNGGGNGGRPVGSFSRSCSNARVENGRLYAQCADTRGDRNGTSIEYGRCRGDISNRNGLLACDGALGRFENDGRPGNGGGNGGGWGGGNNGGRTSITVYEDSNYRGGSATFTREMPNLGRRDLNDNISSMEMNGAWEACSDAYFRGNCQTFTGSVRNLNSTVLNDRISSLRPVRGW
jgi:hypothetical protein